VREILKDRDVIPTQAAADAALQIDMSDVLKRLCITEDCCKRSLATAMDMRDVY
jgi:DNA-directed RNA polymerase subunit N (RpoN/RPB10)